MEILYLQEYLDIKNVYNILSENEKMNIPHAQFYDNKL